MITSLLKNGNFECRNIHFECFKSVSIDSRNIPDDSIFCALKGDHTDGHRFIASAIRNGAKAALVSRQEISGDHLNYPLIIAEDSLKGLQEMARLHLAHLQTPVFALTGSVGKTSTRRLLHHVLSRSMTVFQSQKNFNNHIGLPLSILDIREDHDLAILEMGASYPGDIKELCSIAQPDFGLITRIAQAHMKKFGSFETLKKTKFELFDAVKSSGKLYLNADDKTIASYRHDRRNCVSYSLEGKGDMNFLALPPDGFGCMGFSDGKRETRLQTPGYGAVMNAAAVYTAAKDHAMHPDDIMSAVGSYYPEPGRGFREIWHDMILIDDTYNASPLSVSNALESMKIMNISKKRIFVFGDMLEMGHVSRESHENIGKQAVEADISHFFCYGNDSRYAVSAANNMGINFAKHYSNKKDLAEELHHIMEPGDAILFKGSRGMAMEDIIKIIKDR